MTEISLGKKQRIVNTDNLKGGIKRSDFANDKKSQAIFDAFNTTKTNGKTEILDANEIANLVNLLQNQAGKDNNLSKSEVKNLIKALIHQNPNLKNANVSVDDIYNFVEQLSVKSKKIGQSEVLSDGSVRTISETNGGNNSIKTTTETISNEGALAQDAVANSTMDASGHVTYSKTEMPNNVTVEQFYKTDEHGNAVLDEHGVEIMLKEVSVDADGTVTTFDYENNTKTVKKGPVTTTFSYFEGADGKDKYLPMNSVTDKGSGMQEITTYSRDLDGTLVSTLTKDSAGKVTTIYYAEDGVTPESKQVVDGNKLSRTVYNSEDNTYTEHEFTYDNLDDINNNKRNFKTRTSTVYNSEGHRTSQKKVVDGKEFHVNYDGEGNTTGIIVQFDNQELSIEKFCKKFGITDVAKFKEINGLQANATRLTAGQEVKVPGEMEADAPVLQNRDSASIVAKKQRAYNAKQQRLQSAKEEAAGRTENVTGEFTLPPLSKNSKGEVSGFGGARHVAALLYEREGIRPTEEQLQLRTRELIEDNPNVFESDSIIQGTIYGKIKRGNDRFKSDFKLNIRTAPNSKLAGEITRENDIDTQITEAENFRKGAVLGKKALHAMKSGGTRVDDLRAVIGQVTKDNVVGFLNQFKEESFEAALNDEFNLQAYEDNRNTIASNMFKRVVGKLNEHAKSLGLDVTKYNNPQDLLAAVNALESVEQSRRADMKAQISEQGAQAILGVGATNSVQANEILEAQLKKDGFFGDLYDGLKTLKGSSNTDQAVRADLDAFEQKLNNVKAAYNNPKPPLTAVVSLQNAFENEFGRECDPVMVNSYTETARKLQVSQQLDYYKAEFENHERWTNEQWSSKLDKLMQMEGLPKEQKQIFANLKTQLDNNEISTTDLNNIVNEQVNGLRQQLGNTLSSSSELSRQLGEIGQKLFGSEYDVVARAQNYATSQQEGAQNLKMGVKIVGSIALACTGAGIGVVALDTAALSLATDVGDALYREKVNGGEQISMEEGIHMLKEAAVSGALVYVGGKAYQAAEVLATIDKIPLMLANDTLLGVAAELALTGDITINGTLYNMAFSFAGNLAGAASIRSKGAKPKAEGAPAERTVLEKATVDGTEVSGGKLNAGNMEKARVETQNAARNGTPQKVADTYSQASQHRAANRSQGREQENVVLEENGITRVNQERIDNGTSRSTEVKESINRNIKADADNILAGKVGEPISSHTASTLCDHIANNLKTADDVRAFIQQFEQRVGRDSNGKLFTSFVNNVDQFDRVIKFAEGKLRQINANNAGLNTVNTHIETAKGVSRGLNGDEQAAINSFVERSNSISDLETVLANLRSNSSVKKSANGLIRNIEAKLDVMKVKAAQERVYERKVADIAESEIKKRVISGELNKNQPNNFVEMRAQNVSIEDNAFVSMLTGDLNNKLNTRYTNAAKSFDNIISKHAGEIEILAKKYANNNEKFAQEVANLLSNDFGMEALQVTVNNSIGSNARFNWIDGRVEISGAITDKNQIMELLKHEYVHALQYKDIVTQRGANGIRGLINDHPGIPEAQRPQMIERALNSDYNKNLISNYTGSPANGSIDSYLTDIYATGLSNPARPADVNYRTQLTEAEAYSVGSSSSSRRVSENNGVHNTPETSTHTSSNKPIDVDIFPAGNVVGATERTSVLTAFEQKYLKQQLKHFDATKEILDEISTRIQNGDIPSKDMLNSIITDMAEKTGIKKIDLERDFNRAYKVLDTDWQKLSNMFKTSEADLKANWNPNDKLGKALYNFKEKRGLLSDAELKVKQDAQLKAQQEAEIKAQQEAELKARQEAELKAKQEAEAQAQRELQAKKQETVDRLSEKYPEVASEENFRNPDSTYNLMNLMENYEPTMPFNEQYLYNDIYQAGITVDADMDIAFGLMKKRFYSSVIAKENRVADLVNRYHFTDKTSIDYADNIIAELKNRKASGENLTPSSIEDAINSLADCDSRDFIKIKNMIEEDPDIAKIFRLNIRENTGYIDIAGQHGVNNAISIMDSLENLLNQGKSITPDNFRQIVQNFDSRLRDNGSFISSETLEVLKETIPNDPALGPACKGFLDDVISNIFG